MVSNAGWLRVRDFVFGFSLVPSHRLGFGPRVVRCSESTLEQWLLFFFSWHCCCCKGLYFCFVSRPRHTSFTLLLLWLIDYYSSTTCCWALFLLFQLLERAPSQVRLLTVDAFLFQIHTTHTHPLLPDASSSFHMGACMLSMLIYFERDINRLLSNKNRILLSSIIIRF